ncbi:hypothetical protein Arcpr_0639 [Archaeoglobus profundus DSM 5631]|uniref:Uncharacterized protein n=1 Tax=Archaeoglobus profundus (strain DSM 5631 / JCM 9629 / NBRC 100127 / Av18) TaxID=572546 RepID=D2RHC9_ARCPA|nr:hypothetical protein Arcpr_0639 [Archaeoglobus profundus DSM 5631]
MYWGVYASLAIYIVILAMATAVVRRGFAIHE